MKKVFPVALAACLVPTTVSAGVTAAADRAWQSGDYQKAFAQAIELAENGEADAQFLIGEAYRLGKGTYENILMADVWYYRAANQGHVLAAARLGVICASEHRIDDARRWLRFAADHGDVGSQGSLAAVLFNNFRDERDKAEALALMFRAAAAGSEQAKIQLARMRGEGSVVASPKTSLVEAAAEQQNEPKPTSSIEVSRKLLSSVAISPRPVAAGLRLTASTKLGSHFHSKLANLTKSRSRSRMAWLKAWRVQIGAFSTWANAQMAWSQVAPHIKSLRNSKPFLSQIGALVRVQTKAYSRADAAMLCRKIRAVDGACFLKAASSTISVNFEHSKVPAVLAKADTTQKRW